MLIIDVDSIRNSPWVVLCQNIDGSEPVVPFTSYSLTKAESRYCATRREMLGPIWEWRKESAEIGHGFCRATFNGWKLVYFSSGRLLHKAQTVTKTLMERYVAYFGAPDQLHIDQGQSVEAELMLELGRLIQIQSTAYNL
ncbi:hypothetical protein T05_11623 [Trichinella murrelli]|uniref:Reverse transcriptase RNase H-like domain-containing protein n=1 Tax=Trichinella murrelli TaxID=144512 RepID=A0A0V0UEE0_9BILA|nr:hypothetical protein T05_11623 [Trichinella murrelli]